MTGHHNYLATILGRSKRPYPQTNMPQLPAALITRENLE